MDTNLDEFDDIVVIDEVVDVPVSDSSTSKNNSSDDDVGCTASDNETHNLVSKVRAYLERRVGCETSPVKSNDSNSIKSPTTKAKSKDEIEETKKPIATGCWNPLKRKDISNIGDKNLNVQVIDNLLSDLARVRNNLVAEKSSGGNTTVGKDDNTRSYMDSCDKQSTKRSSKNTTYYKAKGRNERNTDKSNAFWKDKLSSTDIDERSQYDPLSNYRLPLVNRKRSLLPPPVDSKPLKMGIMDMLPSNSRPEPLDLLSDLDSLQSVSSLCYASNRSSSYVSRALQNSDAVIEQTRKSRAFNNEASFGVNRSGRRGLLDVVVDQQRSPLIQAGSTNSPDIGSCSDNLYFELPLQNHSLSGISYGCGIPGLFDDVEVIELDKPHQLDQPKLDDQQSFTIDADMLPSLQSTNNAATCSEFGIKRDVLDRVLLKIAEFPNRSTSPVTVVPAAPRLKTPLMSNYSGYGRPGNDETKPALVVPVQPKKLEPYELIASALSASMLENDKLSTPSSVGIRSKRPLIPETPTTLLPVSYEKRESTRRKGLLIAPPIPVVDLEGSPAQDHPVVSNDGEALLKLLESLDRTTTPPSRSNERSLTDTKSITPSYHSDTSDLSNVPPGIIMGSKNGAAVRSRNDDSHLASSSNIEHNTSGTDDLLKQFLLRQKGAIMQLLNKSQQSSNLDTRHSVPPERHNEEVVENEEEECLRQLENELILKSSHKIKKSESSMGDDDDDKLDALVRKRREEQIKWNVEKQRLHSSKAYDKLKVKTSSPTEHYPKIVDKETNVAVSQQEDRKLFFRENMVRPLGYDVVDNHATSSHSLLKIQSPNGQSKQCDPFESGEDKKMEEFCRDLVQLKDDEINVSKLRALFDHLLTGTRSKVRLDVAKKSKVFEILILLKNLEQLDGLPGATKLNLNILKPVVSFARSLIDEIVI